MKNFNDLGLEAKRSDVNKDVINIVDELGTKVANLNAKKKEAKVIKDNLDKAVRASKHSKEALLDMLNKSVKMVYKEPSKFDKEDGTPDFRLNKKADKAATIIATPDGDKSYDTGIEIKSNFSNLIKRLKSINL